MRRPALAILFALALLGSANANPVFTWVDADGVTHYAETPPVPNTPVKVPARILGSDSEIEGTLCRTSLCEEVLTVDPYCRSSTCTQADEVNDTCFTRDCQDSRRRIRGWIAQLLALAGKALPAGQASSL
jgi:hypothetical protein